MPAHVARRALLAGGAGALSAGALAACAPKDASPPQDTPAPSVAPSSGSSVTAPTSADWKRLAKHVDGTLARPGSSTYDTVRLTQNPRYDGARPLAVLSVADAKDVSTAFAFAQDHGVPVAIRSGGHSYPGWSAGDGTLVVDVRPLDTVEWDGTKALVGAGASLVQVYDAVGSHGRGIAGGSCPTVGIGGLTQGGGVGVLTRAYGLTCDSVLGMEVVAADGSVRRASGADGESADLFWALRGGGGGHLGVVTSFTFQTFAAPTIARAYLAWPFSAAGEVVPRFLETVPSADRRLWATLKLLGGASHPSGPALFMSATWTGPASSMDAALKPLLSTVPTPTTDSRSTATYLETMLTYAGCSSIPVGECHTGPGGSLDREAFAATSHVLTSAHVDTSPLLDHVNAAQETGLKEAGISIDALGGAVNDISPAGTAFGHRGALATVQYTATYDTGAATAATSYVRGFRSAMTPSWGSGAYVNYADASITDYQQAYFGANAAELAMVRSTYDPHGFFTQPQDF
ncbi:MAG TPA: FAD-dependent oxidoreductase [Nocardioides sp.]|uniref:FAD-binding oxidoreductase n=1 Tax=Nocardioides sp. TaxID=35761 RepID=UPI002E36D3E1|nr:FAD-dependent oxidoreductase [Nocardioides sp.]HEX3929673.1 FAD-dependent oxidoreductase [Nocardioides sp.]